MKQEGSAEQDSHFRSWLYRLIFSYRESMGSRQVAMILMPGNDTLPLSPQFWPEAWKFKSHVSMHEKSHITKHQINQNVVHLDMLKHATNDIIILVFSFVVIVFHFLCCRMPGIDLKLSRHCWPEMMGNFSHFKTQLFTIKHSGVDCPHCFQILPKLCRFVNSSNFFVMLALKTLKW